MELELQSNVERSVRGGVCPRRGIVVTVTPGELWLMGVMMYIANPSGLGEGCEVGEDPAGCLRPLY